MNIPILLYHHLVADGQADPAHYEISLQQFEEHLDLLLRWGFSIISFATLVRIIDRLEQPRARMAIITFDDAFQSFFQLALPALQRRGMAATVFVPAGLIGSTNHWDNHSEQPQREIMSAEDLIESAKAGTEIGAHGWAHRSLPNCSDDEAREEIFKSREHLHRLGLAADFFAYPYGQHSPRSCSMVEEAGYRGAVSIFSNAPDVTADRFAMRRIYIHPGDTALRFRIKLSRPYSRYKAMRRMSSPSSTPVVRA
jgi:peptidoglycan/xylan/chitin deacetylase (PgdA/CDA1 family)